MQRCPCTMLSSSSRVAPQFSCSSPRSGIYSSCSTSSWSSSRPSSSSRARAVHCRAERREYYDFKDMPPLPLTVSRIYIPSLGYTVVDRVSQQQRQASLAIFYDIYKDDQYQAKLNRRSAITALCMFDRWANVSALCWLCVVFETEVTGHETQCQLWV